MGKIQTRVSVSFKAEVHQRAKRAAAAKGVSVAHYLELAAVAQCNFDGIEAVPRDEALALLAQQRADGIAAGR